MDWLFRMNAAMDYIESNLAGDIDYEEIARCACCSAFDFQRMFSFVANIPLSEYIRRRRLTLAAFELQSTKINVTELALKYGYSSPVSFARVFQSYHGVTPSSARNKGTTLMVWPRLSFHLTIKGDVEMNYRIEEKEAFKIFGLERIFSTEDEKHFKDIPEFWKSLHETGEFNKLCMAVGVDKYEPGFSPVNSICGYRHTGGSTFPYMAFAMAVPESNNEGYTEFTVPASTWAIFSTDWHTQDQTPAAIQNLIKRVYTDWLPTASYEKIDGCELEMYYGDETGRSRCETWIRVKKK
jgi:AraC family transcriptional regulator